MLVDVGGPIVFHLIITSVVSCERVMSFHIFASVLRTRQPASTNDMTAASRMRGLQAGRAACGLLLRILKLAHCAPAVELLTRSSQSTEVRVRRSESNPDIKSCVISPRKQESSDVKK